MTNIAKLVKLYKNSGIDKIEYFYMPLFILEGVKPVWYNGLYGFDPICIKYLHDLAKTFKKLSLFSQMGKHPLKEFVQVWLYNNENKSINHLDMINWDYLSMETQAKILRYTDVLDFKKLAAGSIKYDANIINMNGSKYKLEYVYCIYSEKAFNEYLLIIKECQAALDKVKHHDFRFKIEISHYEYI